VLHKTDCRRQRTLQLCCNFLICVRHPDESDVEPDSATLRKAPLKKRDVLLNTGMFFVITQYWYVGWTLTRRCPTRTKLGTTANCYQNHPVFRPTAPHPAPHLRENLVLDKPDNVGVAVGRRPARASADVVIIFMNLSGSHALCTYRRFFL
jgi:hypothetical protein